jgi:hypothetical protein
VSINSPRVPQLRCTPPAALSIGGDGSRQCLGRPIVERAIQVAEHAQRVLTRRFGNQTSDMPLISHEHDLFLVTLDSIENSMKFRATSVTDNVFT